MRISNGMMTYGFLSSLGKAQERENNVQEQLMDGKAIHRPSDDPVKTVRSLRNNTDLKANEQFTQNLQDAQSWMRTTDGAMSDLSSIMIKTKELVTSADDTKTPDEKNVIGMQVDQMINQIVAIGNTKVGDRYVFSGQKDSTQPFVRTTVKDPYSDKTQDVVVYNGDSDKVSMRIQHGAANANQDSVNITGNEIFGPVTNVYGNQTVSSLNQLIQIKNELEKTATVSQTNVAGGVGNLTGTYTGVGYTDFDVRIDEVDRGAHTGAGHVTGASYSNDGGNTWIALPAASIDAGNALASPANATKSAKPATLSNSATSTGTSITLPWGMTFHIADSANNKPYYSNATSNPKVINQTATGDVQADVYSFRVPQGDAKIIKSNTTGGAATIAGVYSGKGNTAYSVRITGTNTTGQVTGAEYSTDNGASWGKVSSLATGDPAVLGLSNGIKITVAANMSNGTNDTYSFQVPQGNGGDTKWLSGVATAWVDDDHSMQLKAQTQLGTRMAMYEMTANMMDSQQLNIQTDLSQNEDVDMSKAITDFNTNKTVYQSALAVGSKIMSKSLVDYLP